MFEKIRFGRRVAGVMNCCERVEFIRKAINKDWRVERNGNIRSLQHCDTIICIIDVKIKKILKVGGYSTSDVNGINTILDYYEVDPNVFARLVKGKVELQTKK